MSSALPKRKLLSPEPLHFRPYLEDIEEFEQALRETGADKSSALREAFREYIEKLKALRKEVAHN